jgi:hypothetical protein
MNIRTLLISTMIFISSTTWAGTGDTVHKPMNGGILVTVKDIDYELVADAKVVQIYVRDHGKAVDLSKATAKLMLLSGTEKQEVELKTAGDKLEATGAIKLSPGTKVVLIVSSAGKQATARFVIK